MPVILTAADKAEIAERAAGAKSTAELDAIACDYALTLKEMAAVVRNAPKPEPVNTPNRAERPAAVGKKVCSKCKKAQPVAEFYSHPETKDRLASWCRSCNGRNRNATPNRLVRTRARGRAMYRLIEQHREVFEQLLEEETAKAWAEHEQIVAKASAAGQVDAPVARIKPGPKRREQTSAIERLDVARCPSCHTHHDADHQCPSCDSSTDVWKTTYRQEANAS